MKGRFDFLILHLLSKEEMYGFQIIKRFAENCAEDEFELKTGTLYPLLAAMEDRGFLSSRTASLSGRERKFYRTTEQGKEYLLQQTERWYKWEAFTNKILERLFVTCFELSNVYMLKAHSGTERRSYARTLHELHR